MLSSTYEGVMDEASTAFKKHRVQRIIELRSGPRCFHGPMYAQSHTYISLSFR